MAQTFKRDEARARTFNTMPSYFPFVANILRERSYEMLCSIGIKKGEWSRLPPKMCPSSCHANLTKSPPDDSQDTSPKMQDTAGYVSIHTLKSQIFLKNPRQSPFPS